jgi:hypothetical protein
MKTFYKILGLLIIDFTLIWFWIYKMDPDPSSSIVIFVFIPFLFVLNLIIGGIFFFMKKKEYFKLFLLNGILSSFIFFYLFGKGIDRHQNNRLESWNFKKADSTFRLTRWKKTNEFSMSYSLNPGSSWGFLDGKCTDKNGEWHLTSNLFEMKIINNEKLIGFRNKTDTIKMNKLER